MLLSIVAGKMTQFQDPSPQRGLGVLNTNIIFLLLGIYGYVVSFIDLIQRYLVNGLTLLSRWEYIHSLHVECAFICGQLTFRLSLVSSHILFGSA